MNCPNCEAPVPQGSRFCNNSGYALPAAMAAPHVSASRPPPVPQAPRVPMAQPVRARPAKDPSTALVIELAGTLFGFMGLGWLYARYTNRGIMLLVGWFLVVGLAVVLSVVSAGIFAYLWLPGQIAAAVISGLQVKQAMDRDNVQSWA